MTVDTGGGFVRVLGTEGRLCQMIASRQAIGMRKYGTTVSMNPLTLRSWVLHALEEALDLAVYLLRVLEQLDRESDDGK